MFISKLVATTVAGATFGAGALALAPSQATDGTPDSSGRTAARADHPHGAGLARARHVIHAEWVTRDEVRHEAIRGTVRVVSSRSVTVRATAGVTRTFAVSADTVVRVGGDGQKGKDSISEVKVGDRALVVGKGAHQAVRVLARTPKSDA